MLAAKRKAIDSTCSSLRHLQAISEALRARAIADQKRAKRAGEAVKPAEGEGIARFEASEARQLY